MKNKLAVLSLRMKLTLFTIFTLLCFLGFFIYLMNQNTNLSISSATEPISVVVKQMTITQRGNQEIQNGILFRTTTKAADYKTESSLKEAYTISPDENIKMMPLEPMEEKISFVLNSTAKDIRQYSYGIFFILILAGGVWVYFWSGKLLAPVNQLAEEMKSRTVNNLNRPISGNYTASELKKLSEAFNIMMENLNQSFEIQKRFNANAAHELRTPIAVLQTNLEALAEDENTLEDYIQFYHIAERTVQRMKLLVENLLQMTRMETMERTEEIDLHSLISQICQDAEQIAAQKGISIYHCFDQEEMVLMGRETLFYTAVYNLVDNAVKYNQEGGFVKLYLSKKEEIAEISVSDTGIGMKEKELDAIFQPFYRVDQSRARSRGGAGMGLCLVKNIIQMHQGTIEVCSQEGKGSCFTIRVPLIKK